MPQLTAENPVYQVTFTYDKTFGDDVESESIYFNAGGLTMPVLGEYYTYVYTYNGSTYTAEDLIDAGIAQNCTITVTRTAVAIDLTDTLSTHALTFDEEITEINLSDFIENADDVGGVTFELDSDSLPSGLSYADGKIFGTPTAEGNSTVTMTYTAGNGATAELTLVFYIEKATPEITVNAPTSCTEGDTLDASEIFSTEVLGTFTFTINSDDTGVLTNGDNTIAWTFMPESDNYKTVTGAFTVNATPIAIELTTSSDSLDLTYGVSMEEVDLAKTYVTNSDEITISDITAADLQSGISLEDGTISGTPTAAGNSTVTVTSTPQETARPRH